MDMIISRLIVYVFMNQYKDDIQNSSLIRGYLLLKEISIYCNFKLKYNAVLNYHLEKEQIFYFLLTNNIFKIKKNNIN